MAKPVRSIRLEKRASRTLDILSGSAGEIFFDSDLNSLRLYTDNNNDKLVIADRTWVLDNSFSGDYEDLTNKPEFSAVAFSGDYEDLINTPTFSTNLIDLNDVSIQEPLEIGQGIVWDGVFWSNQSVSSGSTSIANLTDVGLTEPLTLNQALIWNGFAWTNQSLTPILDTNTTYSVSITEVSGGIGVTLAGSDATTDTVSLLAGSNIVLTRLDANSVTVSAAVGSLSIADLSDVDTTTTLPVTGQVLKWNGSNWVPGDDITSGGSGLDADTLDGFDSSYFLNYINLSNTPTLPTSITDLGILDGSNGQILRTNGSGGFSFQTLTLTDLGILDGSNGQVLTTNGSGGFSFTTVSGGIASTGFITFTDATIATSTSDPVTIDEPLITNGNITVFGSVESITVESPEIFSDTTITLNAETRTEVVSSPFRLANLSTTERNGFSAQNGDLIYNTTVNKIQGYQNGTWINLDGTV